MIKQNKNYYVPLLKTYLIYFKIFCPSLFCNKYIFFSRESDSTTTNVRSFVRLSVCLSVTKTPKQLKINHSTLSLSSPPLTLPSTPSHTTSPHHHIHTTSPTPSHTPSPTPSTIPQPPSTQLSLQLSS